MTAVVLEESLGGVEQVAGLEQSEHHREQREAGRVVVGPGDEPEHLDLALDRGSVVGEHVDPVVLRQGRWRAPRRSGEREATRPVEAPHAEPERAGGTLPERRPPPGEELVTTHAFPGVLQRALGVQVLGRAFEHLLEVATAFEVDQRETERAARDLAGHLQHLFLHPERVRVLLDTLGHFRRQRNEQQLQQQHHLHHALAERAVPAPHDLGELVGPERRELRHVQDVPAHRLDGGVDHRPLDVRDPAGGGSGRRHRPGQELGLHLVGRHQVHRGLVGERNRRHGADPMGGCCLSALVIIVIVTP